MNNKKDIEEDRKILENLKNALGTGMCKFGENIDMSKDTGYIEAIENILADRERLEVKANAYDSLVEKIKNKIEKYKKMKDNCNDNEIETKIRLDVKIIGYEELLDTEK